MSGVPTKADISVTGGQGEAATLSGLDLAKSRRAGADGIRDEGRSKMAVVLFHHPRIGVTQVLGNYQKGHAVHSGETCPSVAQRMEVDRGLDFGASTRVRYRPQLMTFRNLPLPGSSNIDPAAAAIMKASISGQRQRSKDACR